MSIIRVQNISTEFKHILIIFTHFNIYIFIKQSVLFKQDILKYC